MKIFLAILIPIAVFLGLGWAAKDIYFSIFEIKHTDTLADIYRGELIAYSLLAIAYNVCTFFFKGINCFENITPTILALSPLVVLVIFCIIPMSVGASVFFSLFIIAIMIYVSFIAYSE